MNSYIDIISWLDRLDRTYIGLSKVLTEIKFQIYGYTNNHIMNVCIIIHKTSLALKTKNQTLLLEKFKLCSQKILWESYIL